MTPQFWSELLRLDDRRQQCAPFLLQLLRRPHARHKSFRCRRQGLQRLGHVPLSWGRRQRGFTQQRAPPPGPTYICGAIGLSFSNSGRRNTAMAPPKHQTKRNNSHTVLDSRRQLHRGLSTGSERLRGGAAECRMRAMRETARLAERIPIK